MFGVKRGIAALTMVIFAASMLALHACGASGQRSLGAGKSAQTTQQADAGAFAQYEESPDLDDLKGSGITVNGINVIPFTADWALDERALSCIEVEQEGDGVRVSLKAPLEQGDLYFGLYDDRNMGLDCEFSDEVSETTAIATAVPVRAGRTDAGIALTRTREDGFAAIPLFTVSRTSAVRTASVTQPGGQNAICSQLRGLLLFGTGKDPDFNVKNIAAYVHFGPLQ